MCDRCDEIEKALERYQRLRGQVNDQKVIEAAGRMIAELEVEKSALHAEEFGSA